MTKYLTPPAYIKSIPTILTLIMIAGFSNAYGEDYGEENASNPLPPLPISIYARSILISADPYVAIIMWTGGGMATPNLKIKYELHYWNTDVTGSGESDWESLHLKPIYLPESMTGKYGEWQYKLAVGAEVIVDFGNDDQGIGSGSDQVAPMLGLALSKGNTSLIPLVQHFTEYSGPDVNTTAFRLIALQAFPNHQMWVKLDSKILVDWENDNETPTSIEAQLGKNYSPAFGAYIDGLFSVGGDRAYDWGVGIGLRLNY